MILAIVLFCTFFAKLLNVGVPQDCIFSPLSHLLFSLAEPLALNVTRYASDFQMDIYDPDLSCKLHLVQSI